MFINIICTIEWHGATWMCQYRQVFMTVLYCFCLTDENNDCWWHVIQDKSCCMQLSPLSIYCGHFFPYNSWKITHSLPVRGRYNGVLFVSANLTKVLSFNCYAVCIIASYITDMSRASSISEDCYAKSVDKYRNFTEFCEMT